MNNPLAFCIGMFLCLLCVAAVYYWEYRYYMASGIPGSGELLIGVATTTLFTWPIWIAFPILAIVFRKSLMKWQVVMAFVPVVLIFTPMLVRVVADAI